MDKEKLEKLVNSKWYLHTQDSRGAFVTCANEVIDFIESLLADKDKEIKDLNLNIVKLQKDILDGLKDKKRIKQLEGALEKGKELVENLIIEGSLSEESIAGQEFLEQVEQQLEKN